MQVSLSAENVVLRGCKLRNTAHVYGITVFTGHDTKIMQNGAKARYKFSNLELYSNKSIAMVLFTQFTMSVIAASVGTKWLFEFAKDNSNAQSYADFKGAYYLDFNPGDSSAPAEFLKQTGTWIILFTNLVPISLLVSLELVKFAQATFMSLDAEMYDEE